MFQKLLARWRPSRVPKAPADPLAAFDRVIDELERQSADLRRGAATLLALRGELTRARGRHAEDRASLAARLAEAGREGGGRVAKVLARDLLALARVEEADAAALARTEADAALLLEAAASVQGELASLREERAGAAARVAAGGVLPESLRARVPRVEHLLALDAARDEVARAHALAEIYREDAGA